MDLLRIRLAKESFKFSATHFTVLNAVDVERLHGHNYQVSVECTLSKTGPLGMGFEFNQLKPHIKSLTNLWDERVLIPKRCTLLSFREEDVLQTAHSVIDLKNERLNRSYRFPKSEVVFLDTNNITSEELARIFTNELVKAWRSDPHCDADLASRVLQIAVSIEETRGQSATYSMESPLTRSDLT